MIKWLLWYLKFSKLFLTLFWIVCFMVLGVNSVNANYQFFQIWIDSFQSDWDSNYSVGVLKRGRFLSNYLWTSKNILALANQKLYFWNDWQLYTYNNVNLNRLQYVQWYMQYVMSCDEITANSSGSVNNCWTPYLVGAYDEVVGNFINSLVMGDWVYVEENLWNQGCWTYCTYNWFNTKVCFSSSTYHHTMCFYGETNTYPSYAHINYPFGSSLWFDNNITFWNINRDVLDEPPKFSSIQWGSQDVSQSELTGDTMNIPCTKQLAYEWYRSQWYKSRVCYSSYLNNSDIYSGSGSVGAFALTWTSIKNIWNNTAHYRRYGWTDTPLWYTDWAKYWRKSYEVYEKNSNIDNPFVGVPVSIFTLMWNFESYWLPYTTESILEFCDLALYTSDYSTAYSWIASSSVCSMSSIEILDVINSNTNNPDDWYPWYWNSNWTISDVGSSWVGITNRPGYYNPPGSNSGSGSSWATVSETYQDWKTFMNWFFNLLKDWFKFPTGSGSPIIPSYIVIALCALAFFRFLSH